MTEETVGKLALKEWRLRKLMSIRQLAKTAGVSTDAIMRAERGVKVWDVTARKIAMALDLTVDDVREFAEEAD